MDYQDILRNVFFFHRLEINGLENGLEKALHTADFDPHGDIPLKPHHGIMDGVNCVCVDKHNNFFFFQR